MKINFNDEETEKLIAQIVKQVRAQTFVSMQYDAVVLRLKKIPKEEFDKLVIEAIQQYLEKYKIADVVRGLIS